MQEETSDSPDGPVSKTRRKAEMHELQALGERLAGLNSDQLKGLDLPDALRQAVDDARQISKHEARRRQMQYIGKLMRTIDPAPIRDKLDELDGQSSSATIALHQLERWRERLINEEGALAEYISSHQRRGIDTQHLRTLIRNVREEREHSKPPRAFRELFRELKRIADDRDSPDEA